MEIDRSPPIQQQGQSRPGQSSTDPFLLRELGSGDQLPHGKSMQNTEDRQFWC